MIFSMQYEYTQEHADAAVEMLRKTVLRDTNIIAAVAAIAVAAVGAVVCCLEGNFVAAIAIAVLLAVGLLVFFFRDADAKVYARLYSPEDGQKYWSSRRTFELYEDRAVVRADYEAPEEMLDDRDRADGEYMRLREEMRRILSNLEYPLDKCRVYESDKAFMICRRPNDSVILLKSQMEAGEAEQLSAAFMQRMGKRYIEIKGETEK